MLYKWHHLHKSHKPGLSTYMSTVYFLRLNKILCSCTTIAYHTHGQQYKTGQANLLQKRISIIIIITISIIIIISTTTTIIIISINTITNTNIIIATNSIITITSSITTVILIISIVIITFETNSNKQLTQTFWCFTYFYCFITRDCSKSTHCYLSKCMVTNICHWNIRILGSIPLKLEAYTDSLVYMSYPFTLCQGCIISTCIKKKLCYSHNHEMPWLH